MKRAFAATVFVFVCVAFLSHQPAFCAVPQLINYQGKLTDKDGKSLNGTYDLTFTLRDHTSNASWSEAHTGVKVTDGLFNVLMGSVKANTLWALFSSNHDLYLEIKVGGETLSPPMKIGSVGYALYADTAAVSIRTLTMPLPSYDSGWQSAGGSVEGFVEGTLTHNLGGNPDNYVVDFKLRNSYGTNVGDVLWKLASNTISYEYLASLDTQFRVRIWKY